MAILKTLPVGGRGVNTASLDIRLLGGYDFTQKPTTTTAKFYDDKYNYALFTGTGFRYEVGGNQITDVTAGTVKTFDLVVSGVKLFSFTGLNLSAAKIFDYYQAGNAKGAWNYFFAASDTVTGTGYGDVLHAGGGNDTIYGRGGNDTLGGDAGNDTLKGETGNDILYGGTGADKLYGGTGKDTFLFKSIAETTNSARDVIFDFKQSEADKISLRAIDANTKTSADDAFTFIGTAAFHKKAGELHYVKSNGDTLIQGDVNGDGKADFTIVLDTLVTLKATDFIL
jgi:serralysin